MASENAIFCSTLNSKEATIITGCEFHSSACKGFLVSTSQFWAGQVEFFTC